MNIIAVYLTIINIAAFVVYGEDKRRAVAGARRIPERTLLLLAAAGGSAGALLGMQAFRHKTRKLLFAAGVPLILIVHIGILAYVLL